MIVVEDASGSDGVVFLDPSDKHWGDEAQQ